MEKALVKIFPRFLITLPRKIKDIVSLVNRGNHSYIIGVMDRVKSLLETGKQLLFEKKAQQSMQIFKEALDECEVEDGLQMGEVFFFLGVSFKKLGHGEYALRCWENSAFARDRSEAIAQKDWRMFHSIQMSRYLSRKGTGQFDTLAECDMVHDLIRMTWYEIYDLDGLQHMGYYQRIAYYRSIHITFPAIGSKQVNQRGEQTGQIVPFIKSDN